MEYPGVKVLRITGVWNFIGIMLYEDLLLDSSWVFCLSSLLCLMVPRILLLADLVYVFLPVRQIYCLTNLMVSLLLLIWRHSLTVIILFFSLKCSWRSLLSSVYLSHIRIEDFYCFFPQAFWTYGVNDLVLLVA